MLKQRYTGNNRAVGMVSELVMFRTACISQYQRQMKGVQMHVYSLLKSTVSLKLLVAWHYFR